MKREKEQWLRIFNGVMFGALILLGFAYCDENSMGAGSENCTSYAKYEFRGKVLGESRQVVPDARILVKHIASPADGSYGYAVLSDTVYTKENGEYLMKICSVDTTFFGKGFYSNIFFLYVFSEKFRKL